MVALARATGVRFVALLRLSSSRAWHLSCERVGRPERTRYARTARLGAYAGTSHPEAWSSCVEWTSSVSIYHSESRKHRGIGWGSVLGHCEVLRLVHASTRPRMLLKPPSTPERHVSDVGARNSEI